MNPQLSRLTHRYVLHPFRIDSFSIDRLDLKAYDQGDAKSMDAHSIGSAAALQVLKGFMTSGGGGGGALGGLFGGHHGDSKNKPQGGGDLQAKLVSDFDP
jgi:hypothetical protein